MFPESVVRRFWQYVDKSGDCWLWTSATNEHGYGQLSVNKKPMKAHRLSMMLHSGQPLTPAQKVLHSCDNPPCVNPAHLYVGTQADNVRDMVERGRCQNPRREFCCNGHPYSGSNLYVSPKGKRGCKACRRAAGRRWKGRAA